MKMQPSKSKKTKGTANKLISQKAKKKKQQQKQRARASPAKKPKKSNVLEASAVASSSSSDAPKKDNNNKTLLVAQEVKFARLLAHNDKKVRDKVLKNLRRWLTVRSKSSFAFIEEDFLRLWKGLFYCMWMSDKPLVQEELAESLSNLVHCFNSIDTALLYTKCTLRSLAAEWFGIDRYRVDKFEMLVRRILRQTFVYCKKLSWKKKCVVGVGKVMEEILLDDKTCLGLKLHITSIFMEELAKISEEQIPTSMVTEFIRPFVIYLASVDDKRQVNHIVKNVFRYLIFQSDVGMDYMEKYEAWRNANFPCASIDEMQKVEVSDDEDASSEEEEEEVEMGFKTQEKPLDPRAGRVDVELPQIPFDPSEIVNLLKENRFHKASTTLTRKQITKLINDFSKLCKGEMPIGLKEIPALDDSRLNAQEAAEELLRFNNELYSDSSKNNKKRKRKNGDIIEPEDNANVDAAIESDASDSFVETSSKSKKQKFSVIEFSDPDDDNTSQDSDDSSKNSKKVERKMKVKSKSNKLNVSEPLPKKKSKKSSNKLNNTFSGSLEESTSASDKSTDKKLTKSVNNVINKTVGQNSAKPNKRLSNNWNIETASPESSLPSTAAQSTPTSTPSKKKTPKKTKVQAENGAIPWLTPVLTRIEDQNKTPTPKKSALMTPKTDSAKKRVKIALQKNMAQNTSEYMRQLLQNPEIPFDANRKPKVGVLKPSPLPSPVNPFYKKKLTM